MTGKKGKSVFWACLLAWMIPGAGHWYAGARWRGVSLFVLICALFLVGVSPCMPGEILPLGPEYEPGDSQNGRVTVVIAWARENIISLISFVMRIGAGVPCLLALALGWGHHDTVKPFFEIGCVYSAVAGTLNLLLVFRVRDIVAGKCQQSEGGTR